MKKITLLKSTSYGGTIYCSGKTYEVKPEIAAKLIELKLAEEVKEPKSESPKK